MPATAPLRHPKECRRRKCNNGEIPHATLRNSICIFEEKVLAKNSSGPSSTQFDPFAGCGNLESLKKRYYQLLKMYHTDNPNGDTSAARWLNAEFERQKQKFNSNEGVPKVMK